MGKLPHKKMPFLFWFLFCVCIFKHSNRIRTISFWELLFLCVPEGSTACHAGNYTLLQARLSSIHPFLFILSLSEWSTDALWVIHSLKKTSCVIWDAHIKPAFYFNVWLHYFFENRSSKPFIVLFPFHLDVVWLNLQKTTITCTDSCVSICEEKSRRAIFPSSLISEPLTVALFVIKWMMTTHFITAQWVIYNICRNRVLSMGQTIGDQGSTSECHHDQSFWYMCVYSFGNLLL